MDLKTHHFLSGVSSKQSLETTQKKYVYCFKDYDRPEIYTKNVNPYRTKVCINCKKLNYIPLEVTLFQLIKNTQVKYNNLQWKYTPPSYLILKSKMCI